MDKDLKEQLKKAAEEPENIALESYRAQEAEAKALEEEEKRIINEKEANDAFSNLDSNKDDILTIEELQSRQIFDTNRDGEVSADEAKVKL